MPRRSVKPPPAKRGCSRRDVLRAAGALALGVFPPLTRGQGDDESVPTSQVSTRPTCEPPWWLGTDHPRSRVIDIRDGQVLEAGVVDPYALATLLGMGVRILTGSRTVKAAWQAVLGSAQNIVIKFNQVGASTLRTNEPLAQVLLGALEEAGYDRNRVRMAEVGESAARDLGVQEPPLGWRPGPRLRGDSEDVAQYLFEADAIINVGLLKTHQIAGMSGSMKNLAYGLLRHPARFHDGGCAPYVGQVIGYREVSSRLRLNIVNALRCVVRRGPDAREEDIIGHGGLLLGYDPVAVDAVGLEVLTTLRRQVGIRAPLDVPYLAAAARLGVGRRAAHEVDRRPHELNG